MIAVGWWGLLMIAKTRGAATKTNSIEQPLPRSQAARSIARRGVAVYRLSLLLSWIMVILSGGYVLLSAEPLWYRFLSFLVLGAMPAIATYAIGWMLYWVSRFASGLYDRVAALLRRTYKHFVRAALPVAQFSIRCTKRTLTILRSCRTGFYRIFSTTATCAMIIVSIGARILIAVFCSRAGSSMRSSELQSFLSGWFRAMPRGFAEVLRQNPVLLDIRGRKFEHSEKVIGYPAAPHFLARR